MEQKKNIAFAFGKRSEEAPERGAIKYPDATYSRDQVWKLAQAFALRMQAAGIGRGATVCLGSADTLVVLATVLATSLLGTRFVQQSGDTDFSQFFEVTHWLHADGDTDAAVPAWFQGTTLAIDAGWSPAEVEIGGARFDGYADPEDEWLIVHTSGTTGYPKFLALSQRIVFDRTMAIRGEFDPEVTQFASLFPPSSRPFLSRALGAILHGCPIHAGLAPKEWHAAGVTMVSGSPVQMQNKLAGVVLDPKIAVAEVLGANMDADLTRHVLLSFARIDHAYGSSETNKAFINVRTLGQDGKIKSRGQKRDGEVEIVDAEGNPCGAGVPGTVRIRNGYMAPGYMTDDEAERMAFRDGWFYPGDRAEWGPDGALLILGRDDHVINIGGVKVHALAIDKALKSVAGIVDAACFKNPKPGAADELFAFVVFEENINQFQAIASARYACEQLAGAAMVPRVIRGVAGVPRRADGYPDREACAAQVLKAAAKQRQA